MLDEQKPNTVRQDPAINDMEKELQRQQEVYLRMDKQDMYRDFINDTPEERSVIEWNPLSLEGRRLAKEIIKPTGKIIKQVEHTYTPTNERYIEILEECDGLPFTVRYQRKDEKGQVVQERYFRYSETAYNEEYKPH